MNSARPTRFSIGMKPTAPGSRLSWLLSRLSPMAKTWPVGHAEFRRVVEPHVVRHLDDAGATTPPGSVSRNWRTVMRGPSPSTV